MTDRITPSKFDAAEGATAFIPTQSFAESAGFVHAISELPGVEKPA